MKTNYVYALLLHVIIFAPSCGKTNPKNTKGPPPTGTQTGCLVKSLTTTSISTPSYIAHFEITYNDKRPNQSKHPAI